MIDREYVAGQFKEYAARYDITNVKIQLKVAHTYRVAELCDRISDSLFLSPEDKDLAWLIGMLHDIARFEQVRIYNSYNDSQTVDHAQFGADLLFGGKLVSQDTHKLIGDYVRDNELTSDDLKILELAIRNHNKYRIDDGLSERETMFANIIRDADKIDIIKANTDFPIWEIYNVSEEEIRNAAITKEVLEAFNEGHAVLRSLKKTAADNIVGHVSLVYELVYPESLRALRELGYLEKFLEFRSENPETRVTLQNVKIRIFEYIDSKNCN